MYSSSFLEEIVQMASRRSFEKQPESLIFQDRFNMPRFRPPLAFFQGKPQKYCWTPKLIIYYREYDTRKKDF